MNQDETNQQKDEVETMTVWELEDLFERYSGNIKVFVYHKSEAREIRSAIMSEDGNLYLMVD